MVYPTLLSGPSVAPKRIGLLGGSFNPAHRGHVATSQYALQRLQLDEVWWLVSPQNPLKSTVDMKPLDQRLRQARALVKNKRRIHVTDLEVSLGTRRTFDALKAIKKHMPKTQFVWLMGADNLQQFNRWHRWQDIFFLMPIAVFRRPGYATAAVSAKAAQRFAAARQSLKDAGRLAIMTPPAWLELDNKLYQVSATSIRLHHKPQQLRKRNKQRGDKKEKNTSR